MQTTATGQITIPKEVREALNIVSETEIDFIKDNDRFYIVKIDKPHITKKFGQFRGIATTTMSTDEILNLTRESL
ncbi:AbrB family transcriptional regulator [Achromatium sp. WMS3]|nr:AbrB family transcriptional regulator [Achromatium sp. WMS3]